MANISKWNGTRKNCGTKVVEGFQLRYIYILDNDFKLNVPEVPFSKIDELNAGMYKGEKISQQERHIMRA